MSVPDSDLLIALSEALETPVSTLLGETVTEAEADQVKAISEKLEIINLQFARRKAMRRSGQYIGILAAVVAYYLVHEGAHLLYALFAGVFKQINFMGIGVQIDVYAERMSEA